MVYHFFYYLLSIARNVLVCVLFEKKKKNDKLSVSERLLSRNLTPIIKRSTFSASTLNPIDPF